MLVKGVPVVSTGVHPTNYVYGSRFVLFCCFVITVDFIENNVCTRLKNCFSAHERVILVFISRVSAETVGHESTYIISFLTQYNEPTNDDKNDDLYTSSPCLILRFLFCWWRHNRLPMTSQWPDNCDAITWKVISNSIDIDFIHGDSHDRSCKKHITFWATFLHTLISKSCHIVC